MQPVVLPATVALVTPHRGYYSTSDMGVICHCQGAVFTESGTKSFNSRHCTKGKQSLSLVPTSSVACHSLGIVKEKDSTQRLRQRRFSFYTRRGKVKISQEQADMLSKRPSEVRPGEALVRRCTNGTLTTISSKHNYHSCGLCVALWHETHQHTNNAIPTPQKTPRIIKTNHLMMIEPT